MKSPGEIESRLQEVRSKLEIIDNRIQQQLDLPFFDRNPNTCLFLSVEKKIFSALEEELTWILHEKSV